MLSQTYDFPIISLTDYSGIPLIWTPEMWTPP